MGYESRAILPVRTHNSGLKTHSSELKTNKIMDRREAIKQLAVLTGGALSFSTVAGIMGGCTTSNSGDFSPQTLSEDQNQLVIDLSERIIPATETPGAKGAKVNEFIDHMLTDWNYEEERDYFLEGLDHVDEVSNKQYDQNFVDLDRTSQISVIETLQQEARDNPNPKPDADLKPFFDMMKEYTVVGYYTSEIGATEELQLDIVPGYYDGCVPYSKIGTAWA